MIFDAVKFDVAHKNNDFFQKFIWYKNKPTSWLHKIK